MALKALLLIADGSEEMETVITADVLRRAEISVTLAGITGDDAVTCSRQVKIVPDTDLASAIQNGPYNVIVIPGGLQGAKTMAKASVLKDILTDQHKSNRIVGAICAAPIALKSHEIALGSTITSHPSVKDQLEGYNYSEARVVKDGNLITSRGPGTAMEFALAIVEAVCGKDVRDKIAKPMIVQE